MQNFLLLLILVASSSYVIFLDYLSLSSRGLEKSIIFPLLILIFIFYRAYTTSWKTTLRHGKWFLLLAGTIVVQMLVVATGGLQSPFLILIHLSMIGMSFFIGFGISVLFLLSSFIVMLVNISFSHNIITFFTANPNNTLLQIVSLFTIIPIAYIISQQYRVKAMLSSILQEKVIKDEKIFKSLQELIIITDADLTILSVNDAVERTLQKPRSELLHTELFNSLLLKDTNGKLVKKETFLQADNTPIPSEEEFSIINASSESQKVSIQVQQIESLRSNKKQLSFILSSTKGPTNSSEVTSTVEKARAKYEAMLQALKAILSKNDTVAGYNPLLFMERIENDLYTVQLLQTNSYQKTLTNIDIAVLCRKLVDQENEFSEFFPVKIVFSIDNFGQEDVNQLTVKNFPISPEKFTGPFFTLPCDANGCEIVMTKILDIAVFLASSTPNAQVTTTVKRDEKNIGIQIKVPNPGLKKTDLSSIFIPNYADLPGKSNILAGSGLEGYIIQKLSTLMDTPISVDFNQEVNSSLIFTWILKKKSEAKLKREQ